MQGRTKDVKSEPSKKVASVVAGIGSFLTPFTGSAINIALPAIQKEFALNALILGWISASFLLSSAMFLVPFGRIADIYGRKKVFLSGISIFTISSFFAALANSTPTLLAGRIFQGIGAAMIFGTAVAILTSVYPPKERGKALGINVAAVYAGLSFGPVLGGILVQHLGWRSLFVSVGLLSTVAFIAGVWKLNGEWAEAKGEKFDLPGAVIYSLALPSLMYGFSALPSAAGWFFVTGGILGLILFVQWELKAQSPLLDINLFRKNLVFAFSNLAALINYSATFAVSFLLSLYLQYIKGLTAQSAGLILVWQPVVMALFSPFAGRLSDRVEPRLVASAGMGLTALGLTFFFFLTRNTPSWAISAVLVLLGFGFALFSSPNTNAVMSSVEKRYYGVASGTLGTMRLTGQMFSMGIAMLVFALFLGGVPITPRYYHLFLRATKTAFLIFALLCTGGIFASLARGNLGGAEAPPKNPAPQEALKS